MIPGYRNATLSPIINAVLTAPEPLYGPTTGHTALHGSQESLTLLTERLHDEKFVLGEHLGESVCGNDLGTERLADARGNGAVRTQVG